MTRIVVKRTINASSDHVFTAVSDIGNLPKTHPDIVGIEFLSEQRSGVGTKFKETRLMNGKKHVTELEVTEYDAGGRIRMIADSHGTVWDSVFSIASAGDATELVITMDCNAHKLLPKLLNPLFKRLYRKGLEKHLDAVKSYCEGQD